MDFEGVRESHLGKAGVVQQYAPSGHLRFGLRPKISTNLGRRNVLLKSAKY